MGMLLKCKFAYCGSTIKLTSFPLSYILIYGLSYRDLGAHIDGFIAVAAHTVIVGSSAGKKVTGRQADVTLAAYWAVQAALRLLKAGNNVSL